MADLDFARDILRNRFGLADFLPGQAEPVAAALDGDDVFVLWPTGAAKSLVYQLPALARPGLTLVVSPLVALIRDQARKLGGSACPPPRCMPISRRRTIARSATARKRGLRLLYLAPERLADPEALAIFRGRACARWRSTRLIAFRNGAMISGRIIGGSPPPPSPSASPRSSLRPPWLPRRRARTSIENLFSAAAPAVRRLLPQALDRAFGDPARPRRLAASARTGRGAARKERSGIVYCATLGGNHRRRPTLPRSSRPVATTAGP